MILLGYDLGSSSIKAALVDSISKRAIQVVKYPDKEMDIMSLKRGWAEQNPELWWKNLILATKKLLQHANINPHDIRAIGITYQMHGLVLVDESQKVVRPSIIWCDSRAVDIGNQAFKDLGKEKCLSRSLNSPGNFTASKLKWVKDHEPEHYERTDKFMLPGDYITMKLTSEINTTVSGLSEGILWDFENERPASFLIDHFGIPASLIPAIERSIDNHGILSQKAADSLGLKKGIPITYKAGDQPNNALSLNVLNPGGVAATGGTSGVVYGVTDKIIYDDQSRLNGFAHINHTPDCRRVGMLLCINGAGIAYNWIRNIISDDLTYGEMELHASKEPIGADGLVVLPFGNGAERMLNNLDLGASIHGVNFNRHGKGHLIRAGLEGIAFSFAYGIKIMKDLGIPVNYIRAGNDNLFQSTIFTNTVSSLADCEVGIFDTTGAIGAARAAGVEVGAYSSVDEAMHDEKPIKKTKEAKYKNEYEEAYMNWYNALIKKLDQ